MGLFDRVTDLLGGTRDRGDPPGGSPDPEAAPRDAPAKQTHGSHWDTLVPPTDREAAIRDLVTRAVETGEAVAAGRHRGREVVGHRLADGPLGTLTLTLGDEIVTAYPVAAGAERPAAVTDSTEWESGLEAWVECDLGTTTVSTFATNYYALDGAPTGAGRVSLSGLLYEFAPAEGGAVAAGDESALDPETVGLTSWQAGAVDDYVVRSVPSAVERVSLLGHEAYRIEAPLRRDPDGEPVHCVFYAGTHLGGDRDPAVGEPFEGAAWLQGRYR